MWNITQQYLALRMYRPLLVMAEYTNYKIKYCSVIERI